METLKPTAAGTISLATEIWSMDYYEAEEGMPRRLCGEGLACQLVSKVYPVHDTSSYNEPSPTMVRLCALCLPGHAIVYWTTPHWMHKHAISRYFCFFLCSYLSSRL